MKSGSPCMRRRKHPNTSPTENLLTTSHAREEETRRDLRMLKMSMILTGHSSGVRDARTVGGRPCLSAPMRALSSGEGMVSGQRYIHRDHAVVQARLFRKYHTACRRPGPTSSKGRLKRCSFPFEFVAGCFPAMDHGVELDVGKVMVSFMCWL